jgi:hypothetical protein
VETASKRPKKNEWKSLACYLNIKNKPQVNKDLVFQSVVGGCCRMETPPCFLSTQNFNGYLLPQTSTIRAQMYIAGKVVLVISKPQPLGKPIKIVVAMHCFTYTYQPPAPEGETSLR